MIKNRKISGALFKKILQSVPIATVDLIVVRGRGKNREFLLGKRANKPYQGKWFLPGGRVLLGETLEDAVKRHLRRELRLRLGHIKFVCHYCFYNPPGNLGVRYYTLYHVYEVMLKSNVRPKHDPENVTLGWFHKIDPAWPKPVREILRHAGFRASS